MGRSSVILWFLLCIMLAAPVYYLALSTELQPATVPTVTLSNGPRTLVLQGMQHVGTPRFYKAVVYDLETALADGYVLFYEGVGKGEPQSDAWFKRLMSGGRDLGDNYRELAQSCSLSYQNDFMRPLVADWQQRPDRHSTVDVNTDVLKREFDRLMKVDPAFADAVARHEAEIKREEATHADGETADGMARFVSWQKHGSAGQRALAGTMCRGIMTAVMKRSASQSTGDLNPLILDFRNRELARHLHESTHDKIVVTYGAAHLPGVIRLLQQQDKAWQIKSVKWMRTIEAPEQAEGQL